MLPQHEHRETEQHWEKRLIFRTAAVTGALIAAVIPATDEIRIVSSRKIQTAA